MHVITRALLLAVLAMLAGHGGKSVSPEPKCLGCGGHKTCQYKDHRKLGRNCPCRGTNKCPLCGGTGKA
jgi:hypothetical protein